MGGDDLRLYSKFVTNLLLEVTVVSPVAVRKNMIDALFDGMADEGVHVFRRYFSPYIALGGFGDD